MEDVDKEPDDTILTKDTIDDTHIEKIDIDPSDKIKTIVLNLLPTEKEKKEYLEYKEKLYFLIDNLFKLINMLSIKYEYRYIHFQNDCTSKCHCIYTKILETIYNRYKPNNIYEVYEDIKDNNPELFAKYYKEAFVSCANSFFKTYFLKPDPDPGFQSSGFLFKSDKLKDIFKENYLDIFFEDKFTRYLKTERDIINAFLKGTIDRLNKIKNKSMVNSAVSFVRSKPNPTIDDKKYKTAIDNYRSYLNWLDRFESAMESLNKTFKETCDYENDKKPKGGKKRRKSKRRKYCRTKTKKH